MQNVRDIFFDRGPGHVLWLVLILFILLLGAGCRSTSVPTEGEAGSAPATPSGVQNFVTRIVEQISFVTRTPDPAAVAAVEEPPVVLDISLTGELPDLDPGLAASQAQLDLAENLFVGLTNFNPETNTVEPELAMTWVIEPDGRTWTFNLRDDFYWVRARSPLPNRGGLASATQIRPVTADDVVFAVQRLCSRQVENALAFSLFIIDGCEDVFTMLKPAEEDLNRISIKAIDSTTLEVTLIEPAGYFLTLTSMSFFQPVPRDLVTELGNEWVDAIGEYSTGWQTPENLVTSGPFLPVMSQTTSLYAVLHRNPLWPLENPGNVDVVNITFLDDAMDAYEMWQDRDFDIATLPPSEREDVLQRQADKVRVIPEHVLFYLGFNFNSGVFQEVEVRRAFSAAIDRQVLVDEIADGRGIAMRHATIPGVVGAIPANELGVGYSPDFARQQMAASSFRSCRLMPEITFLVSSADLSLRQAEIIRDMWVEELECLKENIHIEQMQFGALLASTQQDSSNRPDMWELAWAPTYPDANNLIHDLLHCDDSDNRQNRSCSEADTFLRRARTTVDATERTALYRQAESLFFNESGLFPIVPLYIRSREIVIHDWVQYTPVSFGGEQWSRIVLEADLKELEKSR